MLSTIFIGGGPGGLGPLIWAAQSGLLPPWLAEGIAIVDRRDRLGGSLGRYAINADTLGGTFLECLEASGTPPEMRHLQNDPLALRIEEYRDGFPPLGLVDCFMQRLGGVLEDILSAYPGCTFHRRTEARSVHLHPDGSVEVRIDNLEGSSGTLRARTAVVALGGQQDWMGRVLPNGLALSDCRLRDVAPSDQMLSHAGLAHAAHLLHAEGDRPIVILGGSHSAYSCVWALLNLLPSDVLESHPITVVQDRPPPIFYPSRAAADEDGYPVAPGDICPRTQRVNRLGGLRGDGRQTWRRIAGRPDVPPAPNVSVVTFAQFGPEELKNLLERAAFVVTAFGYRSATLPMFDHRGQRLALNADRGGRSVAQDCRMLLVDGSTVPNVFGIGLGTGYRPHGTMGGEPNFSGQANSFWLYQNDIGAVIYRRIQEVLRETEPRTGSVGRRPSTAGWPLAATVPRSAQ